MEKNRTLRNARPSNGAAWGVQVTTERDVLAVLETRQSWPLEMRAVFENGVVSRNRRKFRHRET